MGQYLRYHGKFPEQAPALTCPALLCDGAANDCELFEKNMCSAPSKNIQKLGLLGQ